MSHKLLPAMHKYSQIILDVANLLKPSPVWFYYNNYLVEWLKWLTAKVQKTATFKVYMEILCVIMQINLKNPTLDLKIPPNSDQNRAFGWISYFFPKIRPKALVWSEFGGIFRNLVGFFRFIHMITHNISIIYFEYCCIWPCAATNFSQSTR